MHVITCQHRDPVDVSDKEEQAEGGENLREPLLETRRSCVIPPTEVRRSSNLRRARHRDIILPRVCRRWLFSVRDVCTVFFLSFEARFHATSTMETLDVVVVFSRQVCRLAQLQDIDLLNYLIMLLPCRYKQLFGNVTCVFHRLMDTFMHSLDIGYGTVSIMELESIAPSSAERSCIKFRSRNNSVVCECIRV